jgi:membrane-associated phospholipid phosphatase
MRAMILAALLVLSTALTGLSAEDRVEPGAGTWKTWMLTSGSELRLSRPPDRTTTKAEVAALEAMEAKRDADALALIAYWNAGDPAYRWNQMAIDETIRRGIPHPIGSRAVALMQVAIYDAMVATWDSKYVFNRPHPSEVDATLHPVLPNPQSPSYPSEHAAAAGAASEVLAWLFPDRAEFFRKEAEAAGMSRQLAGVHYQSDVDTGLALGRAVAERAIDRGKTDGTDAKWTGTVPTGPGKWIGSNPIFPLAGTWKSWVLARPDEFRPAPPPAFDSLQKAKELAEIKDLQRTPSMAGRAFFWEYGAGGLRGFQYWNDQASQAILANGLATNPPRAARAYAVTSIVWYDTVIACWEAKYTYWAIRPSQLDPDVKPLFPPPNHPSYPAAHGCLSTAAATAIGRLFPPDAKRLDDLAVEAAEARVWAGIHYRSDIIAGRELGRAVAEKVVAAFGTSTP